MDELEMTKAVTEKELAEKAVAPRVTKSDIESLKDRITYTTEQCPGGTTSTFVHAFLDGKFFLATGLSNSILFLGAQRGVVCLTSGGEYMVDSEGALTPTTVNINEHSAYRDWETMLSASQS